jgi:DNA-directed RNA polymerase specialized sigma24 family protein
MAIERRDSYDGELDPALTAAQAGAAWALERIYEGLSPAVAGLFRAQGVDDPDDLTSEVFVGVLRNLAWFDGDTKSFRSWVFTIAYRRLADEHRRVARRPAPLPLAARIRAPQVVETMGLEPTTPCLQTVRLCCPEAADLVSPRRPTASK